MNPTAGPVLDFYHFLDGSLCILVGNPHTNDLHFQVLQDFLGYGMQDFTGYSEFLQRFNSEDLPKQSDDPGREEPSTGWVKNARLRSKRGDWEWVQVRCMPLPQNNAQGGEQRLMILVPILQLNFGMRALLTHEAKSRSIVRQVPVGIALANREGQIVEWNQVLEEITGYSFTEAQSMPIWDFQKKFMPGRHAARVISDVEVRKSLADEVFFTPERKFTSTIKHKNGDIRWVNSILFPIQTESGQLIGMVVQDSTAQHQIEVRLRQEGKYLKAGTRLAMRLNVGLDLDQIMEAACQEIAQALDVDYAVLQLLDPTEEALTIQKAYSQPGLPGLQALRRSLPRQLFQNLRDQQGPLLVIKDARRVPGLIEPEAVQVVDIYSVLMASMECDGELIGAISVCTVAEPRDFSEEDGRFLQICASQVAKIIAHVQLDERNRRQAQHMQLLNRISQISLETDDVRQILPQISREIQNILSVDNCLFSLWDERRQILIPAVSDASSLDRFWEVEAQLGENSVSKKVLDAGKPLVFQSADFGLSKIEELDGKDNHAAILGLPLQVRDQTLGLAVLIFRTQRVNIYPDELRQYEELAAQLSLAIDKALLLDLELQKRAKEKAVQQLVSEINSNLNIQKVLEAIVANLEKLVPYHGAAVALFDHWYAPDVTLRIFDPILTIDESKIPASVKERREGALVSLFRNQPLPWILDDIQVYPGQDSQYFMPKVSPNSHGWMGIPMIANSNSIGYITVFHHEQGIYSQKDSDLVKSFADQAAVAIENSKLYEYTQQQAHRIHRLNEITRLTLEGTSLSDTLRTLTQQVTRVLNAEGCYISLWDTVLDEPVPSMGYGELADAFLALRGRYGRRMISKTVHITNQIQFIPNYASSPYYDPDHEFTRSTKSFVGLPLRVRDSRLGAMVVQYPSGLAEDQLPVSLGEWEEIASQVSLAVYKAVLLEQETEERIEAGLLQQATAALLSTSNLDESLDAILDALKQRIQYDMAAFTILLGDHTLQNIFIRPKGSLGINNLEPYPVSESFTRFFHPSTPTLFDDIQEYPGPVLHAIRAFPQLHGSMVVDMRVNEKLIGSLSVASNQPSAYTMRHAQTAKKFANLAALAIVNDRLHQENRHRSQHMWILSEITRLALEASGVAELLQKISTYLVNEMALRGCYAFLYDPADELVFPFAAVGETTVNYTIPPVGPAKPPLLKLILASEAPVFTTFSGPRAGEAEPATEIRNVLGLPLRVGDDKLGVMILAYESENAFIKPRYLADWKEIAAHISLAMAKATHLEQEQRRRHQAEMLQQSTSVLTSYLSLPQVLENILQLLAQAIPIFRAGILLHEEESLVLAASWPEPPDKGILNQPVPENITFYMTIDEAEAPVIIDDLGNHPIFANAKPYTDGINGFLGIPLIDSGNHIGYLIAGRAGKLRFTQEDAIYAQAFARQAAIAIQNARLFEQVRHGRERLQNLSIKLVEIQEAERKMIARELHDQVGQDLTAMMMLMDTSKQLKDQEQVAMLGEAQLLASKMMDEIRGLSLRLRPTALDDLGLLYALNGLYNRFQQQTGIQIHRVMHGLEGRFDSTIETTAFRVIQEALTNIGRYAEVQEVWISVTHADGHLNIVVEDQGKGFDLAILEDKDRSFGINGMYERVTLVGGLFDIRSSAGNGTRIHASLPLEGIVERRQHEREDSNSR